MFAPRIRFIVAGIALLIVAAALVVLTQVMNTTGGPG
jgi:hypothetical protein